MYQALLTRRYLTSKIMPWLAMVSVALCCMVTLVVWSIMGGFSDVFRDIGRKMEGDVSITWPTVGFGHYEELIGRLEKDPMVAAAAPVIRTFGMVSLPDGRLFGANIQGVDERYSNVGNFDASLWWRPLDKANRKDAKEQDPRLDPTWPEMSERLFQRVRTMEDGSPIEPPPPGSFRPWKQMYEDGKRMMVRDPVTGRDRPAAVPGIELGGFSQRQPGGWYKAPQFAASRRPDGKNVWSSAFLPSRSISITVLPMDSQGRDISTRSMKLPVANEFRTGFFETDKNSMLVHLSVLQNLLKMEAGEAVETADLNPYAVEGDGADEIVQQPRVVRAEAAKVTTVLVRAKPGITSEQLRDRCLIIYREFAAAQAGQVPSIEQMEQSRGVTTWERTFAVFLGQVKKETITVLMMLLLISLVCTALILAIFWSMVNEKTKDIGILRSVGCSRTGVAWIWLRYGAVIGVVGGVLGLGLGCAIVWNINPIHDWLGQVAGISVWDPSVYYLPEIPNVVKPDKAGIVFGSALALSLLGAMIPSVRAANMDPVRALRFE